LIEGEPMENRKLRVEAFKEKLEWSIAKLVPQRIRTPNAGDHSTPKNSGDIHNLANLYDRLVNDAGDERFLSRGKWFKDIREDKCSPEILNMIREIYPELTVELLTRTDFAEFCAATQELVDRRTHYIGLGTHFLAERERLALFSKDYYSGRDETPDWPLLGRKSWRPLRPIPIDETSSIDRFEPGATYPEAQNVPGLNARYGQIRRLLSPRAMPPFNGDCYRLLDIDFARPGGPIFSYGPCKYFDYYDTCEIHALKIASLQRDGTVAIDIDPFDIGAHAAVPGVNTLTVLRNFRIPGQSSRDSFMLHRRSGKTVQAGNTLHVAPSGQHQPSQAFFGLDADVSIWRTMVREFCEELYNVPEAHGLSASAGDPLASPPFRRIVDPIFRSGASRVYLLGAGLDPVTAKPEILLVNIIDFGKVPIQQRDQLSTHRPNWEGTFQFCELSEVQIDTQLHLDRAHDLRWLPAGKACLAEFRRHFHTLI
jgi:hypothetical protein